MLPLPEIRPRGNVPAHIEPFPSPVKRAMMTSVGRLSRTTRWILVAGALGLLALLATARLLRPDPRGYGTHTQLGLLPCGFQATTGYPCPSCGMTTALAWATRGRLDRAWRANPAGCLLAPIFALTVVWLLASAASGRPRWGARSVDGPVIVLVVASVATSLLAWTLRLLFLGRVFG
jgi:hypothetical protein